MILVVLIIFKSGSGKPPAGSLLVSNNIDRIRLNNTISSSIMSKALDKSIWIYKFRGAKQGGGVGGVSTPPPLNFGWGVEHLSTPPDFEKNFLGGGWLPLN